MKTIIEERCKAVFDGYLHSLLETIALDWRDGDEPPDYYLTIAGTEYAVEVTSLMLRHQVGRTTLATRGINNSLEAFVQDIQRLALDKDILRGTYVVSFSAPLAKFKAIQEVLSARLLDYIAHTRELEASSQQTVYGTGRKTCRIEKLHAQSDKVVVGLPVVMRWEGEAAREICALLEERILTKIKKLRDLEQPKILLLKDSYHFADPMMFRNCVQHLSNEATMLHTIFVVQEDRGFVLWSQDPNWHDH